jgi:hypothetical protein
VDQKPFNYTGSHTRKFGDASEETLAPRQREILEEQKKKFADFVYRPQKYMPEPTEPMCL